MKKKCVAMMLCMAMTVAALAGCGNSTPSTTESSEEKESTTASETSTETVDAESEAGEEEGIPLDYFAGVEVEIAIIAPQPGDDATFVSNNPMLKQAEEATGIKINWTVIDEGVIDERMSTILASGDLPDAMLGIMPTIQGNEELFYDLSEEGLLETYAPDVLEDYENGGQSVMKLLTQTDGSIRSLATGHGYTYTTSPSGIIHIKKDWLDQLGMDVPTTTDEFYEVLKAFKENDMNGNGDATDEIPLTFVDASWCGDFIQLATSFGIVGQRANVARYGYMYEDGVVKSTYDTEEFRAFLEYYNKLASEGLIDVEGFSQTDEQASTKLNENRVGVYLGWTPSDELGYVGMVAPQGIEGVEPRQTGGFSMFYGYTNGFVISADCENVEALLHWWNYLSSETAYKYNLRIGEENIDWYQDEDGNIWTMPPEGVEVDETRRAPGLSKPQSIPYIMPSEQFTTDTTKGRGAAVAVVADHMMKPEEILVDRPVDAEKAEERDFIQTDFMAYVQQFMADSVINGITDESWNTHLNDLKNYGYYEWLDWYQAYADGEF